MAKKRGIDRDEVARVFSRGEGMQMGAGGQVGRMVQAGKVLEAIIPNPKLKRMDQVREVMRLKHYSIRTEQCYYTHVLRQGGCGMKSPLDCCECKGASQAL